MSIGLQLHSFDLSGWGHGVSEPLPEVRPTVGWLKYVVGAWVSSTVDPEGLEADVSEGNIIDVVRKKDTEWTPFPFEFTQRCIPLGHTDVLLPYPPLVDIRGNHQIEAKGTSKRFRVFTERGSREDRETTRVSRQLECACDRAIDVRLKYAHEVRHLAV